MTDRAIVVIGFLVVEWHRLQSVMKGSIHRLKSVPHRDHVLMFVMGKLNRELALVFCLRLLRRVVGLAESEAGLLARRGAHMTYRADCRPGSNHRLAREELLAMTTNARIMIGKVGHVGKISLRSPASRNLVTFVAGEILVLVG